jgi:DNA-binding transcriptional LysR family regulator
MATIDLNHLRTFVGVARDLSFSAAAGKLEVPTSTVSRGIADLEELLGVRLFNRTTRHVSLTPEGAGLHERLAPLIDALGTAVASVPVGGPPKGVLRLTAAPDIGATFLAETAARFTAQYPSVSVEVWITNRRVDLVAEGVDMAIRATRERLQDSALLARKLMPLEFHLFGSPDYLSLRGMPRSPADIAKHDWVEFRGWKHPKEIVLPAQGPRLVSDDFLFVREALRAGGGLGFLPAFLAQADARAGQLVRVLPRVHQTGGSLTLLYAKTKPVPPRVTAFRDFLLSSFARPAAESQSLIRHRAPRPAPDPP